MIKQIITTLLLIGVVNVTLSQTLRTFKGTVDYKFHLSSTNKVKPSQRSAFESEIAPYSKKIKLLSSYYTALNKGHTKDAKAILSRDTSLLKDDTFTLAYMFSLAKMKQLGILYKPCIQVNDNDAEQKLIVCSIEQQKEFINHANSKKYELHCKYIGDLIKDNMQVYKLISYK